MNWTANQHAGFWVEVELGSRKEGASVEMFDTGVSSKQAQATPSPAAAVLKPPKQTTDTNQGDTKKPGDPKVVTVADNTSTKKDKLGVASVGSSMGTTVVKTIQSSDKLGGKTGGKDTFEMQNTLGALGDKKVFDVADKAGDGKSDGKVDREDMDRVITLADKAEKGELKRKPAVVTISATTDNSDNTTHTDTDPNPGANPVTDTDTDNTDEPEYTDEEVDALKEFASSAGGGESLERHRTELVDATTDKQYDTDGSGGLSFQEVQAINLFAVKEKPVKEWQPVSTDDDSAGDAAAPAGNPFSVSAVLSGLSGNSTLYKKADDNGDGNLDITEINKFLKSLQGTDLSTDTDEAKFLRQLAGISNFNQLKEEAQNKFKTDVKNINPLSATEKSAVTDNQYSSDAIPGLNPTEAAAAAKQLNQTLTQQVWV